MSIVYIILYTMELAIPLVALGGLYIVSKQNKNEEQEEGFVGYQELPNTNLPDKNYPSEQPITTPEYSQTARLTVDNRYNGSTYTDKYFKPNSLDGSISLKESISLDNKSAPTVGAIEQENLNTQGEEFRSLTGETLNSNNFRHNNMVPFFGGKNTARNVDINQESLLDNHLGKGSQQIEKKERAPLFAPNDNYQWAYGAPNQNDFMMSRVNASSKISNVLPFEQEKVGPGLNKGYGTEGSGGFNSGMEDRQAWMPKTVDELRVKTHSKASGVGLFGHEGPAVSSIKEMGSIGKMEKHRPERSFELGHDRVMTTTGIEKGVTLRPIQEDRYTNRPETTASYTGGAGANNEGTFVDGEYMPSKHIDLGSVPLSVANAVGRGGARDGDYGIKSQVNYNNNRSANHQTDYFGAFSGAVGSVVAPLLDVLRPSRKENTIGTLRPYQNASTRVTQSYVFNPADRPATTIRETTENSKFHMNAGNSTLDKGGYTVASVQPIENNRMNQSDFYYAGNASAGAGTKEARPYDAEYRQHNNEIKSSTIKGRMVPGNMSMMNNNVNYTTKDITTQLSNKRAPLPERFQGPPSTDTMGHLQGKLDLPSEIPNNRNGNELLSSLKKNPYALSITG